MKWSVLSLMIFLISLSWGSGQANPSSSATYSVMIDAGSSGSRVRIYQWQTVQDNCNDLPDIKEIGKLSIKPGISDFPQNLPGLEAHMLELLTKAKDTVPQHLHSVTPIYVFSTAGKNPFLKLYFV